MTEPVTYSVTFLQFQRLRLALRVVMRSSDEEARRQARVMWALLNKIEEAAVTRRVTTDIPTDTGAGVNSVDNSEGSVVGDAGIEPATPPV